MKFNRSVTGSFLYLVLSGCVRRSPRVRQLIPPMKCACGHMYSQVAMSVPVNEGTEAFTPKEASIPLHSPFPTVTVLFDILVPRTFVAKPGASILCVTYSSCFVGQRKKTTDITMCSYVRTYIA